MRTRTLLLHGLGQVGRRFLALLRERGPLVEARHGLRLQVVGAVDSQGWALDPAGLPLDSLLDLKAVGGSLVDLPGLGRKGNGLHALEALRPDVLLEAAPTNFWNAQPGLQVAQAALALGSDVVFASKGALVLAQEELQTLAAGKGARLRFSGAVCAALPALDLGLRSLPVARIHRVEGVLNLTGQLLLDRMGEGLGLDEALAEAGALGLLEADPALDVDGWDAAAKLLITARTVLGSRRRLDQVEVRGIRTADPAEAARLRAAGGRLALLATAEPEGQDWRLAVRPTPLGPEHPFARLEPLEGAIAYETDLYGRVMAFCARQGPLGTAAALLRDLIDLSTN